MNEERFVKDLEEYIEGSVKVMKLLKTQTKQIKDIALALEKAREHGKIIYIIGNGGSASTASHMANDLNKAAITEGTRRFRAVALTDNVPVITAWANDDSYDSIFAEQLKNHLDDGDVVIGISGSGNSPNIIKAIEYANSKGNLTIGLTGLLNPNGGKLGKMAKLALLIQDSSMWRVEDFHLVLNHALIYCFKHQKD